MNIPSSQVRESCYGVELENGTLLVAEATNGKPVLTACYPADEQGIAALRQHIQNDKAYPRVCVRSCGAGALAIAIALLAVPRVEVMLVAPHALAIASPSGTRVMPGTAQARAERLAVMAKRML